MKRENLTWQELWPLIGDGQCFDYQNMEGWRAFQFVGGQLFFYSSGDWKVHCSPLDAACYFKIVDDPSKPKKLMPDPIDDSKEMLEEIEQRKKYEQRRRDMFERVVMMIVSNSYCGMTSHGELFDVASKLTTDILKESDKFARGE